MPAEERACASCGKAERPWRRMMVKPLGASLWAFVCSEQCWDDLDAKKDASDAG